MVHLGVIDEIMAPVEPAFLHFYDFPLDPFQVEAIDHIRNAQSVMVAAPTSSGKTLVAEYAIWRCLAAGARAIYTTPIKALSNQKRRDLEAIFPGQVGLLTGDRSENPEAPIVVMTTEVLRNMLVEDAEPLSNVDVVVFDEVHYLADADRGTVWEEAIITCPQHVQLVCLSATIANAEEIAHWISQTHRPIALVRHDERPVPLDHYYFTSDKLHLVRDGQGARQERFLREGKMPLPQPAAVVRAMQRASLLPAIWFAFSRRAVEESAAAVAEAAPRPDPLQRAEIEEAIAHTLHILPEEDRGLPQLSALVALLRRGVGFHHAGLLPPLKELVERLFTSGHLSVVCATDTLAVGINMPARTVVISSLSRPFGGILTPNDFSQLTGRAGRRGIDEWGSIVLLPSPYHGFEEAYRQACAPLQPIHSAFRLRYSTLLSAVEGSDDRLTNLVQSSLRQYQMKRAARQAAVDLELLHQEHGEIAGDVEGQDYLALQADLSRAEKEQKRARNARAKSGKGQQAQRRYESARAEREHLTHKLRSHAFHGKAATLERQEPQVLSALRSMSSLESTIQQAQRECDRDAAETAAAVRAVLSRLGYMRGNGLTRKARGMREIVAASGIVLSELYEAGVFDRLDPASLAEVISWFASDVNRRRYNDFHLPRHLTRLRKLALETFRRIASIEEREGIELAQGPSSWFYGVAYAWCQGHSIEEITDLVEMGEGDVVSSLNKTVDLVDQFGDMLERYGDVELLAVISEARRMLVRGLVALVRQG